jgi:hypothetical protein
MKKLLVVAVVLGLGAVVYAKVIRSSPEKQACQRLDTLCGGDVDMGECREAFDEAGKLFGDKVVDKATDCMSSANSCMEAAGCIGGASTHVLEDFQRGFDRAKR